MTQAAASLEDRIAIQDVICAITLNGDLRNFDQVYTFYTPDAEFDYSSLFGVPGTQRRDEFRANNMKFRPAVNTLHQVTNFMITVNGDTAKSRSTVRAITMVDELMAENGGIYTHRLVRTPEGWRVNYIRYDVLFQRGDDVFPAARRKMEAMQASETA